MKKKVWIWNHYATSMLTDTAGRHYWFAENLINQGYEPTIFCANTKHNSNEVINVGESAHKEIVKNNIPFVIVKSTPYSGNGKERIRNMFSFYRNLFQVSKEYVNKYGKPDVIIASSVHPLTLVAGIKIAKKMGIPCICEIRDLWPESIVAYGALKRNSVLAKVLYQGEKWIYKNADSIIMTWAGGRDYIIDRGWDKQVAINKIHHINNGVVIDTFDINSKKYVVEDADLEDQKYKNIIYAGSIRKVNNIGMILDAAKIIQEEGLKDIRFLIYGSGDEKEELEKRCKEECIYNVTFKGRVDKKYIPFILKKAYVNLLHNSSTSLDKYGQSQNKFFEYLAAGKCIVQTYTTGYSICREYNCGISAQVQNPKEIARTVIDACSNEQKNKLMGKNAREASYHFDFKELTKKLINIIETV